MKKLLHRVGCIVLLLAVITLTSCKKEASDGIDNSATNAEAPSGETASGLGNTVDGGSKKPDAVINDDTVGAPSADNTGGGGVEPAHPTQPEDKNDIPAEHIHSWSSKVVAATCTEGGYTLNTCACGGTQKINQTAALGHNFGGWITVKEATKSETGLQRRTCSRCGEAEEKTLDKLPQASDNWEQEILRLVNEERVKNGLNPLEYYTAGQSVADLRASEIKGTFSHTRPNGESCFTALDEAGINYRTAGENIAYGYQSPAAVMQGWMNSDGHRANILNANFTHIIVGVNGTHWVQLFIVI